MTLPTVSIGIPTYNRAAMLGRAIDSVRGQTYAGSIAIVVVDDGSTDNTRDVLRQYMNRAALWAPNRTLAVEHHDQNRGIAFAKNRCVQAAGGELRGILDSDDWYDPRFVERCVETLTGDVIYSDNYIVDEQGRHVRDDPAGDWDDGHALLRCQLRGSCWLARATVLKKTRWHDERFELDVDYSLFFDLWRVGARFQRLPECLMYHTRGHAVSASNARTAAAYWQAANLGKYGFPVDWAERRARNNPEWLPAIRDGYAFGVRCREEDQRA